MSEDPEAFKARIGTSQRQYRFGRHAGTERKIPVIRDDNGAMSGMQTEHWSGRVDCNIFAPTIIKSASQGEVR